MKKKIQNEFDERIIYKIRETAYDENITFISSIEILYEDFVFEILNIKDNESGIVRYARSLGIYKQQNLTAHFVLIGNEEEDAILIENLSDELRYFVLPGCYEGQKFNLVVDTYFKKYNPETVSDSCVICLSEPPTLFFTSCGHRCICMECKNKLDLHKIIKCPLCRKINRIIINKK